MRDSAICPRSLENPVSGSTRVSTGLSESTAPGINHLTNIQHQRLLASLASQRPLLKANPGFVFRLFAVLYLFAQSSSSHSEVAQDSTQT